MSARDGFEHEVKVTVPTGFELPAFDGFEELSAGSVELAATYWDTADLRLTGWGHSLRQRTASDGSESGWTLKLSGEGSRFALRREVTFDEASATPPPAALDVLRGLVGRSEVVPVAVLTTQRTYRRLRHLDTGSTIEVDDDDVRSTVAGDEGPSFREIEVEFVDGDDVVLRRASKLLRRAGADAADPTPKVARALAGSTVAEAAPVPERPRTVGELVRRAIAEGTRQLLAHDPAIRLAGEENDIHKARVATRRLRSDLKSLIGYCDETRVQGLRKELAWLGGVLGHVRDTDVLVGTLDERAARLTDVDADALAALHARVQAERAEALVTLLDVMRSSRYHGLIADLQRLSVTPPLGDGVDGDAPAKPAARSLTSHSFDRVSRRVRRLPKAAPVEELHEVRKAAKQARYAAELVGPLAHGRTDELAERLTHLQDELGATQDAVTARDWLHHVAADGRDTGEAFLAGRLAEAFTREISTPLSWRGAWKRAAAPGPRRWLR